jgi:hypothetical protein
MVHSGSLPLIADAFKSPTAWGSQAVNDRGRIPRLDVTAVAVVQGFVQ